MISQVSENPVLPSHFNTLLPGKKRTSKLNNKKSNGLPLGKVVEDIGPLQNPGKREYSGEFVTLHPVEPERDVDELFLNSHGSDVKERIWTYMAYGPFPTRGDISLSALNKSLLNPT